MARRTDFLPSGGAGDSATGPAREPDTGNDEWPAVRRTRTGVIDIAHYERRAYELRSRFIRSCLHHLVGRFVGFWLRRRAEAELNALDDRALHDIGITRSDIPSIVSGSYSEDASRRQRRPSVRGSTSPVERRSVTVRDDQPNAGKEPLALSNAQRARQFAETWIEAWNRHDVDAVLAHFSDRVEFSSPLVCQFVGEASGRLVSKEALRAYWQTGLSHLPGLHFKLVDVLVGIDCLTVLYRGHRGISAEVFDLDASGVAVRARALYSESTGDAAWKRPGANLGGARS